MRAVVYYRVSTAAQGRSGLGLEAQQDAVERLCAARGWQIIEPPFREVESGKRDDRPILAAAIAQAKLRCAVLVVAKMDRVGRRAAKFLTLLESSGVQFVAADDPEADWTSIAIKAVIAQHEGDAISKRTKEALQAAKARGTRLGNPNGAAALRRAGKGNAAALEVVRSGAAARAEGLRTVVEDMRARGIASLGALAAELNAGGYVTARGGGWHASSVRNLIARLG